MHDLAHQFLFGLPNATPDDVAGEDPKPDLDLIQPGGVGWGEIECQAPALGSSFHNLRDFMGTAVVDNHKEFFAGLLPVKKIEKIEKLLVGMPVQYRKKLYYGCTEWDFK